MKQSIKIILFLLTANVFSQNIGDNFRKEGNLEKAIDAYKSEFTKNNSDSNNTYNLACVYALTSQKDSAFHYLNIALKKDTRLWALADNDLLTLTDDKRWKEIENNQINRFQAKNGKLKNLNYTKELLGLIMKDQALDYQLEMAKRFYMKNKKIPHWYYPISQMKKDVGKDNFSQIKRLIK